MTAAGGTPGARGPAWGAMRKSHRVSTMVSGWLEPRRLEAGEGGTACLAIGCSDDFYAVRLGFPNLSPEPWRLRRVIGRASAAYGDYVTPTGASAWTDFTFSAAGADAEHVAVPGTAPREIVVSAMQSGAGGVPAWTWTDWAPIRSLEPDPRGLRVLMLRGLVPSGQTITYAVGQMRTILGDHALHRGFDVFVGGLKFDLDRVAEAGEAGPERTQSWIDNQLAVGSLFPMVQFLTARPGLTGMVVGDSNQAGTATTEQMTSFFYRALCRSMPALGGQVPLGMVNAAQGGLATDAMFGRMFALLDAVRPGYVILPGWAYNDVIDGVHAGPVSMDRFYAGLLAALEGCAARGIVPVLTTPFPRDSASMGPAQHATWHTLRDRILGLRGAGLAVIDASEILGARAGDMLTGAYRPELTTDGRHPDDRGHGILSECFRLSPEALA